MISFNLRILQFELGVGDEVNQQELEMLASGYDHVYLLNDLNSLSDVQDKLTARFCRGKTYLRSSGRNPSCCRSAWPTHLSKEKGTVLSYQIIAETNCWRFWFTQRYTVGGYIRNNLCIRDSFWFVLLLFRSNANGVCLSIFFMSLWLLPSSCFLCEQK